MGLIQKFTGTLKKRSSAIAAVSAAFMLAAAVLVVQSSPRSELDVELSDGAVWLASTAVGGVSLLDGGSGTIAASLGVAQPGDEFTVEQFGSDAVIVNETDGTVARLDGSSWEIPTGRVQFGVPGQPLHVVAGDDTGWLMTPGQATTVELEGLALRTPVPVAAPFADGIITDDGALLYASTDPQLPVQRFDAVGGASVNIDDLDGPTSLIDLGTSIAAVDLDDGTVWLDGVGTVCDELEFPDGATLNAGGGDGQLIVVSDQGGAFVWDPAASGCPTAASFINIGAGTYGEPALTDGWAVVPERSTSSVLVIDLEDMSVVSRQSLEGVEPGAEVSLIAEDGSIWYNDAASAQAGLIRRDGTIVPISKYEEGATGFTTAPVSDAPEGSDDMSLAGAQDEPEELEEEAPEAEVAAGPEITTTTVAGAGEEPEPEAPEVTQPTTPTTEGGTTPTTDGGDTSSTTEGGTTATTDGGDGGTTPTTDGGDGETTTTTEEEPIIAITIGVSAFSVVAGNDINFTAVTQHGNPNSWDIEFSPTGPQTLPIEQFGSFRVLFPEVGRFVATMTACDADNECATAQAIVDIVEDPDAIPLEAAIDGPASVVVGEAATFTDISQGDPDSWTWSTDGGSPASSTNQTVDIAWATPGPRTVTLTVGRGGSTKTTTFDIDVVNAPTPAPFGIICSPTTADVGESVTCQLDGDADDFSDITFTTSADGSPGFTSSDLSPGRFRLTSSTSGLITVTLNATDVGTGSARADNTTINYQEVLCATVIPTVTVDGPSTLEVGQIGSFTGTPSTGCGDSSRSWSATGGGTIASPASDTTNISWASAGDYTVTYDFADGGGPGSRSMTVTVTEAPVEPDPPSITLNGPTSLDTDENGSYSVTNSGGAIASYSWSTNGGGGSGSNQNFTGSWSSAGSYTVTLTVTGVGGDTDTATRNVTVEDVVVPPPPFGMSCSVNSAEVDQIFGCDLTTGDAANFSNPQWSVGPASAQSWLMSEWSYDAAGTVAGSTVTVTLTATVTATGQTVSSSDSVDITAPVVQPAAMNIGCDQGTAEMLEIVSCFLTTPQSQVSNPSWSVAGDHDSWGGSDFALDVAGNSVGSITVTLSATDVATGQTVSDSVTITITAIAPTPPPQMSVSCSMINTIRARCTASNTSEYSSPSWAVSGDGLLRWGGTNVFTIEVGTTVAGSTITVTVTATHTSGQVTNASGSITIAEAT